VERALGLFYTSAAIVSDGSTPPEPIRDPDLYYEMSTVPGARLPHAWVGDNRIKIATMDLVPYPQWTLITGIAGEAWAGAADKIGHELDIPLETVVIGPGRTVTDLYYDWARLREIEEGGALLVRPDKHIAWRSMRLPDDPGTALRAALTQILGLT
jgi:2,4-dichlorophenol 6-monooxygenase